MTKPMTDEALERLESDNPCDGGCRAWECADEIRRLQEENEGLRRAIDEEGWKSLNKLEAKFEAENAKLREVINKWIPAHIRRALPELDEEAK